MITETPENEGSGISSYIELTPDGSSLVVLTTPTDNVLVTVNVASLLRQD